MCARLLAASLAALVLGGCPDPGPSASSSPGPVELRVLAAASLGEPVRALAAGFERSHPGARVLVSVGSSSMLERQVEAGAPVDVFVSAATGPVERLEAKGLLDPATRTVVARNTLVVVVPKGEAAPAALADLARLERVAVGQSGVPVGEYAREALRAAGLGDANLAGYPDEPAVLGAVADGAAQAGLVYASSLVAHARRDAVTRALEVDPRLHAPIVYPAGVGKESADPALARRLLEHLRGAEARATLGAAGFLVDGPP